MPKERDIEKGPGLFDRKVESAQGGDVHVEDGLPRKWLLLGNWKGNNTKMKISGSC